MQANSMIKWFVAKCLLLRNPHYGPAGYAARFLVNVGTLIWGMMVVFIDGQLNPERFPFYQPLLEIMHENVWGWGAIATSGAGLYRIKCTCFPRWWDKIGYSSIAFFWIYITIGLFTTLPRPVPAATAGAFIIVCILALYAVGSSPRNCNGSR
jgi:hypothetical protein